MRVIDLFKQMDDDNSGHISAYEFIKAMSEFGLDAPQAVGAVFRSLDVDGSGSIEYAELHRLLTRSLAKAPGLSAFSAKAVSSTTSGTTTPSPIVTKSANPTALRPVTAATKKDGNLFAGFKLVLGEGSESIPVQIRAELHKRQVRGPADDREASASSSPSTAFPCSPQRCPTLRRRPASSTCSSRWTPTAPSTSLPPSSSRR